MCLEAAVHTGEDFEVTECKDYVGRLSAALIRHASKHYAAARRFNGARRRRVRREDGELNSLKIPHVRTQAAHPPANRPWSVLCKCLTGF